VRLESADNCSQHMVEFLLQQFSLQRADLYQVDGPVNLYRLREVPDQVDKPALKYPVPAGMPAALGTATLRELKKNDVCCTTPSSRSCR
jgi:polyphosphate kinase